MALLTHVKVDPTYFPLRAEFEKTRQSWSDFARELELEKESETSSDKPQEPDNTGREERGAPVGDSRVTDTDEAGGVVMSDVKDDFKTEWKRKETEKLHL